MEKKNKKTIEIVKENRERALKIFFYNINKMYFLPKVDDVERYSAINKVKLMGHILSHNFETGIYLNENLINDKGYTVRDVETKDGTYRKDNPLVVEYLKEVDKETGHKQYRFFNQYNVEQLNEKEEVLNIINELKPEVIESTKKYNLKSNVLHKYWNENKLDELERVIFFGILKMYTGNKNFSYKYHYEKEEIQTLIDMVKEDIEEVIKMIYKIDKLVKEYLENNEIVEEEVE